MIIFNIALQAQGFVLVDVLPHFCEDKNTSDHYFSASQGINVFTYPIKDCKIGFDCCFFAMTIITSSRRAPAVLQNKTK